MLESFAKIALAWFGNPIRGLGATMIAALLALSLHRVTWFTTTAQDHFWRWCLLALIASFAGLSTYPIEKVWKAASATLSAKKARERTLARLGKLTSSEKHVLAQYLEDETTVRNWDRFGGCVNALADDGILSLIATNPDRQTLTPDLYRIDQIVWDHLNQHPELVDLERRPVTPSQP